MARKKQQNDPRRKGRRSQNELDQTSQRGLSKREKRNATRRGEAISDEYDYITDDVGITKASMKKAMRYVIISLVFLLFAIGVFFGSVVLRETNIRNQKYSCWEYQQAVQTLATNYMQENGFASLPAYVEDVPGFQEKKCPHGGEYTWDPINGTYTCSYHGDPPATFNQAKSVTTGRTTVITNKNSD